ncbi:MAG: malic enzyme [Lysobacteraceae bacterium]|nr:MAG: malic enzyme [Xanthomonadaceae bacterium]
MSDKLKQQALEYHRSPTPGKIRVVPSKALTTQHELSLAYSPGVAAACEAIVEDENAASEMTSRANLVGVITNGTAVLGLGSIGPLAAKPVMEGKGVLFQKFAGIDVFDIEIDENDPDKLVDIIASLAPTFGGINLEDIKAPECFEVERRLRDRLKIPVFHDDQHGTAIITGAAVINALRLVEKDIAKVKLVTSGAGAAGIACLDMLVALGLKKENITATDRHGVVYVGRSEDMDDRKAGYAQDTDARTLGEVIDGADIFLGVSAPGVLSADMVKRMADQPIILALANPIPEIMPDVAREARPDAIIATGRSDFPNQVNNVLCFPYMFRGALDVGATCINEEMKRAAVLALAELARKEASDVVQQAYGGESLTFGPEYLIPKPFDPRLPVFLAPAIAKAAMDSGVATRPLTDLQAYEDKMTQFVFRTGLVMKPLFDAAKANPQRVIYAEGEEEVVLSAVQAVIDDGVAKPILVGRPEVVQMRIDRLGLRIRPDVDFELINPDKDDRFKQYWTLLHQLMERHGYTPEIAKTITRTRTSVIAALALLIGDADAAICGVIGRFHKQLKYILDVVGLKEGVESAATLSGILARDDNMYFMCDTYVNPDPSAEQIADATLLAAERMLDFGIRPRVALLSHSSFGSHLDHSARKMKQAAAILHQRAPNLEVEGEMHADAALDPELRRRIFPNSRLQGQANLLVMPNVDAANISFHLTRIATGGVAIGPILLGAAKPIHVMTASSTVRRLVNMTAIAAVDAQKAESSKGQRQLEI